MENYGMTVSFMDKKKREIKITIEDDWPPIVIAKHNGDEVGKLEFSEEEHTGLPILSHAYVLEPYQMAGIGTEMVREMVDLAADLLVPNPQWCASTGHENYLSEEGAKLLNSCVRKKIIKDHNIAEY